ncbi:MAG TPA: CusA/CzcA family heavy metal efflux RND transporter, partial [Turneriella sp.]|nr:CusA/CzcA family heavy metal efflux RND transporter [Turneriella sp.]
QVIFEDGVDDYWARTRVLERLNDAEIPEGVSIEVAPPWGPVSEIYRYVLVSNQDHTPMDLRTIQNWTVIPRLMRAGGVVDVVNFGGLQKQYHVVTTPQKLAAYRLTIQQVIAAIQANNVNTGGNIIRRGEQGFIVRAVGQIRRADDIRNIVVNQQAGVPVFIWQIATVEEHPLIPLGVLGYALKEKNKPIEISDSAVQGLVVMRRDAAVDDTLKNVKAAIYELNTNGALPEGVQIKETYDRGDLVNYTIKTVGKTLFEGISIVTLILIFFIGSVRSALVVATTIPISLLFAFILMRITGIHANLLSLGAIDFGIIVDGAVVMVENLMRNYRERGNDEESLTALTFRSAREVGKEIFFSITIIVLAYLPIFTFERVEGKLFSPMAFTLAYAILGSMLLALTAIPALMTYLYRKAHKEKIIDKIEWHNPLYAWIEKKYAVIVAYTLPRSKKVLGSAFFILVFSLGIGYWRIGTEFLPELDEGAINIRAIFPIGISLDAAKEYTPLIRDTIAANDEVKVVLTQLGRNDDGSDPYGPNRLEVLVGLKDYSEWKSGSKKPDLLKKIKRQLTEKIPGVNFLFSQPILDNVTEAVTGSVGDLAILINGSDLTRMREIAKRILDVLQKIPGSSEAGIEQEGNQAQLNIEINREKAARFGINVADIQSMVEAAIGARVIGKLYDGPMRFDIVVRYAAPYRNSVKAVEDLLINAPGGARIPLSQLADINFKDGPTMIQRQDGKRQISVRTNIRGRDQGGFAKEAQIKVKALEIPPEFRIAWGGQYENLARAGKRLAVVTPLTIMVIFILLFSLYRNVRDVWAVMACLPLALVGGILALALRGYQFNVSSGVGFISLFGISVMTGVLYVSRVRQLMRENTHLLLKTAVEEAAVTQLRPRLMTILLALMGLVPAMLATGIGSDVQRPLATVIVGGMAAQLVLTLIVLPSIFLLLNSKHSTLRV